MSRRSLELLSALLVSSTPLSCSEVDLGRAPEFNWWSDHESGDLRDWTDGGTGYQWTNERGSLELVTQPTRSGQFSVRATVVATDGDGRISSALVSRRGSVPREAYFSAWFLIPQTIEATSYWLIFKFRSPNAGQGSELWDIDVAPPAPGFSGLRVRLYSHQMATDVAPLSAQYAELPIGRWFQTEAFFRAASDASGQLSVWIDGNHVFEISGRPTAPDSNVEWSIGAATETMTPSSASLYFDDAAITSVRLGPHSPAFSRTD